MSYRGLAIGGFLFLQFALASLAPAAPAPATSDAVTIDYGVDLGAATQRGSGLLHGFSKTEPADALITGLKPKMWRCMERPAGWAGTGTMGCFDAYDRFKSLSPNGTVQYVLSMSFAGNYPTAGSQLMTDWVNKVAEIVNRAAREGKRFHWDIWNEPDLSGFWNGTQADFFETWKQGYRKIRELDPAATIVGPSAAGNQTFIRKFLLYAKANSVLPDIISWHYNLGDSGRKIVSDIHGLKSFMAANGIGINRFSINEHAHNPAFNLASFEAARVESVAHACQGQAVCDSPTLDGLTSNGHEWHAYKGYADITGRIVSVIPGATIDGVAGHDSSTLAARAILGRKPTHTGSFTLKLKNLDSANYLVGNGRIRVIVQGIKWWRSPERILDTTVTVVNNEAQVTVPDYCVDPAGRNCASPSLYRTFLIQVRNPSGTPAP